jgi:Icc-related predicted phosphoesterase
VAGLGGCLRYRDGPNQYTERQQARRARRLARAAARRTRRDARPVDLLLAHAPPRDLGDGADPAHRGFAALRPLVAAVRPRLLLHGHVHPYGAAAPDRRLDATLVRNVVGAHVLELGTAATPVGERGRDAR